MVQTKNVVAWTIDKAIIKKINQEAETYDRSRSYIANKYLKEVLNEN